MVQGRRADGIRLAEKGEIRRARFVTGGFVTGGFVTGTARGAALLLGVANDRPSHGGTSACAELYR